MQDDDRLGSALENLRKAVELAPRDHFATNNLCDVHVRLQKETAVSVCKEAVRGEHLATTISGAALTVYRWTRRPSPSTRRSASTTSTARTTPPRRGARRPRCSRPRGDSSRRRPPRCVPSRSTRPTSGRRCRSACELGRWDEAVSDLRRVNTLRPQDDDKMLVNHLGQTLSWRGHAEAQALYRETVQQKGYWLDPRQRPPQLPARGAQPTVVRQSRASWSPAARQMPRWCASAGAGRRAGAGGDAAGARCADGESRVPQLGDLAPGVVAAAAGGAAQRQGLPRRPRRMPRKVWHVAAAPLGPASPYDASQYPGTCSLLTEIGETTGLSVRTAQFSGRLRTAHPAALRLHERQARAAPRDRRAGRRDHSWRRAEMVVADEVGGWVEGRVTVFDDSTSTRC